MIMNDVGKFEDGRKSTFKLTDVQGVASIIYKGASCGEIPGDMEVVIRVQLTESNYQDLTIKIIEQK